MLRISKMADYATLVMVQCALQPQSLSANDIAHKTHLNMPTVSKCLKKLCQAGLLLSHRGVQGGYQLALAPERISLAAIVEAIDGHLALTQCNQPMQACELHSHCATRQGWQLINQAVHKALNNVFLTDMLATTSSKAM